ncbi:MAG: hypothetical protein HKN50_10950 [Gammaproteobacteria bacterium]|nr:hypothetical protein [Gammaproteobacteria bacterium]
MTRLLKIGLQVILSLLLLSTVLVAWLGLTASGLSFVLERVPGLTIQGPVQGRLLGSMQFAQLQLEADQASVVVEGLEIHWRPAALFGNVLEINDLVLNSALIDTSNTGDNKTDAAAAEFKLPFDISLGKLNAKQIEWQRANAGTLDLDTLQLSAELSGSTLRLKDAVAVRGAERVSLSGSLNLSLVDSGEVQLDFTHTLSHSLNLSTPLRGNGSLSGTWEQLTLQHQALAPYAAHTQGIVRHGLSAQPEWDLTLGLNGLELPFNNDVKLSGNLASAGSLDANTVIGGLDIVTTPMQFRMDLDALVAGTKLQLNRLAVSENDDSGSTEALLVSGQLENYLALTSGRLDELTNTDVSLQGEWQNLKFLNGLLQRELPDSKGSFVLQGRVDDYQFKLNAETESTAFKRIAANLSGSGSRHALKTDSFNLQGDGLALNAVATAQFGDQPLTVQLEPLRGTLRGEPISGSARFSQIESGWQVERLNLATQGALVAARGRIGRNSNLNWKFDADDLGVLDARFKGRVNSSGTLTGAIERPAINSQFTATNLAINAWQLQSANGSLNFGLLPESAIRGSAELVDVRFKGSPWLESAELDLSGSLEQHRATVNGTLVGHQPGQLVWNGQYVDSVLSFSGALQRMPAQILTPVTASQPWTASGTVNSTYSGQYDGQAMRLESVFSADEIAFRSKADPEQVLLLQEVHSTLDANDAIQFGLRATLQDGGSLNTRLRIADKLLSPSIFKAPINGQLTTEYQDLRALQALLPDTVSVAGQLVATADFSGTLSNPALALQANLRGGQLNLRQQGVSLSAIKMDIDALPDNQFKLSGSAVAGSGQLEIAGMLDGTDLRQPQGQIKITARDALFIENPTIKAEGNADLEVNLTGRNVHIDGDVAMQRADIKVGKPLTVVQESPDLVLQGIESEKRLLTLSMRLGLDLGDNTTVSANGLSGKLVGQPTVRLSRDGLLTSVGEIQVVAGKFNILGETLSINNGRLSYAGGAISNPYLSFEAGKTIGDIRAGISIEGNADAPRLALYSQPFYDDQDILALVFFEKPLADLSTSDALKLVSIANALRGGSTDSKIDTVTDTIAGYLGVDKLDLSLDANSQQRKLLVSSKINSRLDIGYAYNFITSLQSLFLRYKIRDRWSIQSSVDVESGADIKYRVETD